MRKILMTILSLILVLVIVVSCAPSEPAEPTDAPSGTEAPGPTEEPSQTEPTGKVYNVVNLVNGTLGDRSFFDSAEAGLAELKAAGRITYTTIEMGGTDADQPKWLSTLYDVSESGEYDLIICGTYQMPEYLNEVAAEYPDQKYLIYDSAGEGDNIVNINYKQNDMGYLVGVFAGAMTVETDLDNINEESVVGFVGGVDSPVINDFLYGFLLGAQESNPDIKVDTRYVNSYVDPARAKELAISMINDNNCDIIWGVAGNSGNGAAEAALETGKAWFIGVDSDQELTFSDELASITLTSGLKNIGNSIVWFFDELDAGREHYGEDLLLGIPEGGVGIVTDKNYDTYASEEVKALVQAAQDAIVSGEIEVPTAIGEETGAVEALRDSLQP
ncbi:MAG: BMP family ABC transporter substrate-binding protein [Eubacteriales bacterium]|nr:BMP family ABC transporter substrate-binding protein [Eubacteriales bacterium]MDD4323206.1 BMP family ABC transporter substrate-binding protein [Eubacteriales bacterium]